MGWLILIGREWAIMLSDAGAGESSAGDWGWLVGVADGAGARSRCLRQAGRSVAGKQRGDDGLDSWIDQNAHGCAGSPIRLASGSVSLRECASMIQLRCAPEQ